MNFSKQRNAILSCLAERKDHPTADMIYESVRKEYPKISLGTVYRNLSLLCDSGVIVRLPAVNGNDRFDYDTSPHCHFVCRKCSGVSDIYTDMRNLVNYRGLEKIPGKIEKASLTVYGICPDCGRLEFGETSSVC